ncbi:MAG: polynucleotide adenylyltransferase PcnB [Candidatus Eutrophobiaceae bacterium]
MKSGVNSKLPCKAYPVWGILHRQMAPKRQSGATRIPTARHSVSNQLISTNAMAVLHGLHAAGHEAYLVGGGVRDLLLGKKPKDFDVATDAKPERVRQLFRRSILIGRRFRLVHVGFGRNLVEVSTYRADKQEHGTAKRGNMDGNVYGHSMDEDARRRDFTVNALFYDVRDSAVLDCVNGMRDLETRQLRLIGDPRLRYAEDPVRMLRALRFAAKLDMRIHSETEKHILPMGQLLAEIPPSRLLVEIEKIFMSGAALQCFYLLRQYDLLHWLFPEANALLKKDWEGGYMHRLTELALRNTDARLQAGEPATSGFLFGAFLWESLLRTFEGFRGRTDRLPMEFWHEAMEEVFLRQSQHVSLTHRMRKMIAGIWGMQPLLEKQIPYREIGSHHRWFRAAWDFLNLRCEAGEDLRDSVEYWRDLREQTEPLQKGRFSRRGGKSG